MTADELRKAVRPYLQNQSSMLSSRLLGDYQKNNGQVDFYYRRGLDNVPYVFFVAPSDPRPTPGYNYKNPGFFSDPSLSAASRVSQVTINGSGDTTHEKLKLPVGETVVYSEDEAGDVYRLSFVVPAPDSKEISVRIARRMK
jgi:hypothetical protein